ncbi:MAG TPA: bifunctional adenosylcobinamide kinase/adenosylcobinamide-phosphate guanylyltransferase [Desulfobulbus sp.]|nr:bifunctional adenosylcobinamide kinase/adenosylcobinamide-phosphate guanylyltransferase [Desulfobulbus sp.]
MAELVLISGGSRSGKSDFARQLAESLAGPHIFLATCPDVDDEMAERIQRHREQRRNSGWQTIEEPQDPAGALARCPDGATVLIDCLTLWVSNLMYKAGLQERHLDEDEVLEKTEQLADAARRHRGAVIMVTGEVGQGVVPDNRQARLYRDLVGRCNQCMGSRADAVYLVSCGIPLQLKGK